MALMQLPVPRLQAGGSVLDSRCRRSSFLSSGSHVGVGCDDVRLPHFLQGYRRSSSVLKFRRTAEMDLFSQRFSRGRQSGYFAVSSDSRRAQGNDYYPQRTSDGRRDGYHTSRSDTRRTEGNDFYPQRTSDGGQDGYLTSRLDSRRNNYNPEHSSGGKEDGSRTTPWSDSRRNQGRNSGRNSNVQNSSGGRQSRYGTPRLDSRRNQGNDFKSPRNSQGRNDKEGRDWSGGLDARRTSSGQDRGKLSGRNSSNKTPNPVTQTVTPRQSTSQFVSDRSVHRAPWEQGGSSTSSWGFPERDFPQRNILIERLQKMQEEVENDDEEDSDDVDDDFAGLDDDSGTRDSESDASARSDGRIEKSAMARIVEKLSNIPGPRNRYESKNRGSLDLREGPESTFGPKYGQPMFPTVGRDWSISDHPVVTSGAPPSVKKLPPDTRFPWERDDDTGASEAPERVTRVKPPSLAELTVPEAEMKRLRNLGILMRHRIKIGKMGVTNAIVESIQNEWRNSEVVRVKCEGPPAQNMKRTHEALEERTGGLVVWRAGGACLLYRGKDYGAPVQKGLSDFAEEFTPESAAKTDENKDDVEDGETEEVEEGSNQRTAEQRIVVPRVNSVYDPDLEKEMEEILSSLGPRYDDWTGMKPTPVDADLLTGPQVVFRKPLRRLPYGVRSALSNLELTNLRRLARPLPPHFVLGVNRGLDGLAAAIVKLWEKSEIAKIAVKRGVQNTNHERMAEQLKRLTGGVLLARDKFFIVLYRGKDFLPPSVSKVLEERQALTDALQEEEERLRLLPQRKEVSDTLGEKSIAGTLAETLEARANWEKLQDSDAERRNREAAEKAARRDMARRIHRKVAITLSKKNRAELEMQKVEKRLRPAGPPLDRENITDEERHMFSKLGLKMHAFLLLGRRGIFGGTVENMHLHWKHRQLVKIIYKARDKIDLEQTARMLEYESGGILIATVPTSKGQAIIVYRGKNYQRPPELRPRTLLTKRQALKRSIEMQRQQALARHLLTLQKQIEDMQADLVKLGDEESNGSSELTAIDSGNLSDEDTKESAIFSGSDLPEEGSEGRNNVVAGLAAAIYIHFQTHALVKVGVRGRSNSIPVEELVHQLEEATGGKLVSQEASKVILYRGWPEGQERPTEGNRAWEELPTGLRSAMISELEADNDYLHESDWDEPEDENDAEADEQNDEDEDFWKVSATMGSSEVDDDSDWDVEENEAEADEQNDEDEDFWKASVTMGSSEVDDDSD